MNRERWYPTVITLANGDPFIAGHGPNAEPNGPQGCLPTWAELNQQTWDRISWSPLGLTSADLTISRIGMACDSSDALASVGAYPRLHLLTTGKILHADAIRARFLDVLNPACNPGQPGEEERWEQNSMSLPSVVRNGGNSVHLVYPDPDEQGFVPVDVIYAIAGTDGEDDNVCDSGGAIHVEVDKYVKPGLSTFWNDPDDPPDLNYARFNHNAILLLDGSIGVNGGSDGMTCQGDPLPLERYRPPEIFGPSQGTAWGVSGAIEPAHRRYHSVAGLLPDGRVFSAGGNFQPDYHTVSLYEPPCCFYARPEITSSPAEIQYQPEPPFLINVTLSSASNTVERVALVRTGSITHAWDMNQRYVVLEVVNTMGTSPDLTLLVQPPRDGYVAPPGYYFLTVVEKTPLMGEGKWVPSPGAWIRVDQ